MAGALGAAASALPASAVTIGNMGGGNRYPFNCTDSDTSVGQSMDYQEIYLGIAVGPITTSQVSLQSYPFGTPQLLRGTYDITFGTTTSTLGAGYPVPVSNVETLATGTLRTLSTRCGGSPPLILSPRESALPALLASQTGTLPAAPRYSWPQVAVGRVGCALRTRKDRGP